MGVGLKILKWTDYLFHFLSAKLHFFTLCFKQDLYFTFLIFFLSTKLAPRLGFKYSSEG